MINFVVVLINPLQLFHLFHAQPWNKKIHSPHHERIVTALVQENFVIFLMPLQ